MAGIPIHCPSCQGVLDAVQLECSTCGTRVDGRFRPCPVCRLDAATRELFDEFLRARGNLKEVQRSLGVSYPTVRARIDVMFQKLGQGESADPMEVLSRVRRGEITIDEAEEILARRTTR